MNIRELEYFITIAEKGNLTAAADALYVSQPTLSKYIERLENEVGVDLFERVSRSMRLTEAGERYLQYANQILALKYDLDVEMKSLQKGNNGTLRVGFPQMRANFLLPTIIPLFKEKYPNVDLEVVEYSSQDLDNHLKAGKVDLVIYLTDFYSPDFSYQKIRKEKLCVVLPFNHPLSKGKVSGKDSIVFEKLQNETLILQKKTNRHSQYLLNFLENRNIVPPKIKEGSNLSVSISLAVNGYGITFVSDGLLKLAKRKFDFEYYYLQNMEMPLDLVAVYRKSWSIPAYAQYFIELVKEN